MECFPCTRTVKTKGGWVRGKDVFPQKKTGKHMISALIASCHFWNPILHPRLVSRVLNPPVLVAMMLMFSISAWTWKHRRWDGWYSKWHQVTIFGGINDGVNSRCMFPKTYQIDFLYLNTWMWCFAQDMQLCMCAKTIAYQLSQRQ